MTAPSARRRSPPTGWRRRLLRIRPGKVHRARALDLTGRSLLLATVLVIGVLPFVSAVVALRSGWRPVGDNALIGLRVHDVLRGRFPLTGQPTTGENFGSRIASNHPGPIEFYLVAPFVAIFGSTWGVALGAAAINAGAMASTVWVAFRRGGVALALLAGGFLLLMTRSIGGNILHDPVSSQVGAMAAVLVIFTAWSVAAGDVRLIPLFLFAASYAMQDHLAYLATVGPVAAAGVAGGAWWLWRGRVTAARRPPARSRNALYVALGFFVVWLPVLWDELFGSANLQAVYRTFSGRRTVTEGVSFAYHRFLDSVGPVPLFARTVPPLGYLRTPSTFASLGAAVVVASIIALSVLAWRRQRIDLVAQAVIGLAAIVGGVYSAVKLPSGAGVQTSNLRWMWYVSLFLWLTLLWQAWELVRPSDRRLVRPYAAALLAVLLPFGWVETAATVRLSTDRDGRLTKPLDAFSTAVRRELPRGSYQVVFRGGPVLLTLGPGLVYDLDNHGYHPYLDLGVFTRTYTSYRTYRGQPVRGQLLVTSERSVVPDGARFLGSMRFTNNLGAPSGSPDEVVAYLLAPGAKLQS